MAEDQRPQSGDFASFYHEYLTAHTRTSTRAAHVLGTLAFVAGAAAAAVTLEAKWLLFGVVTAYSAAWASHAFLERNHPKTLSRPLFSLLADFRMTFEVVIGKLPVKREPARQAQSASSTTR